MVNESSGTGAAPQPKPKEETENGATIPPGADAPAHLRFPKKRLHWYLVTVGIFVWAVAIPGAVAFIDGVFTDEQVRTKIDGFPEIKKQKQERDAKIDLLKKIDGRLASTEALKGEEIKALLSARADLNKDIEAPKHGTGFFTNSTTSVFLVCYLCLTALLCIGLNVYPGVNPPKGRTLEAGFFAYLSFAIFNWVRNGFPHGEARKIYSFTHFDIGPLSFWFQEFRLLGIFLLIAAVNLLWYEGLKTTQAELSKWKNPEGGIHVDSLAELSQLVSGKFALWQGTSLVLAIAFLPWTYFYWQEMRIYGDRRYVESALLTHLFWGLSWIAISAPAWFSLRTWAKNKSFALVRGIAAAKNEAASEAVSKVVHELEPIGYLQLFVTSAVAFGSFLVPVIHSVISFMSGR